MCVLLWLCEGGGVGAEAVALVEVVLVEGLHTTHKKQSAPLFSLMGMWWWVCVSDQSRDDIALGLRFEARHGLVTQRLIHAPVPLRDSLEQHLRVLNHLHHTHRHTQSHSHSLRRRLQQWYGWLCACLTSCCRMGSMCWTMEA